MALIDFFGSACGFRLVLAPETLATSDQLLQVICGEQKQIIEPLTCPQFPAKGLEGQPEYADPVRTNWTKPGGTLADFSDIPILGA
jgi:hypothetical protein